MSPPPGAADRMFDQKKRPAASFARPAGAQRRNSTKLIKIHDRDNSKNEADQPQGRFGKILMIDYEL